MRLCDLTGQTFNRLRVIERDHNHGERTAWKCVCECGAEHWATGNNLKQGRVASCGCLRVEANKSRIKVKS